MRKRIHSPPAERGMFVKSAFIATAFATHAGAYSTS